MDTLDPKPGYATTEFWVTIGTIIVTAVVAIGAMFNLNFSKDHLDALIPALAPLAAGIASAVYSIARAKTKSAHYAALTTLNQAAPAVVSHGVVNVTPVVTESQLNDDGSTGGGI